MVKRSRLTMQIEPRIAMIELFVIKESEWYELVTESVTLEGERYQAPRSIEASIVIKQGSHKYYSVQEGDTVLFKWKGKELFRGIVFSRSERRRDF